MTFCGLFLETPGFKSGERWDPGLILPEDKGMDALCSLQGAHWICHKGCHPISMGLDSLLRVKNGKYLERMGKQKDITK